MESTLYVAGLLNLLRSAGDFVKVWSACGQNEIQYAEVTINKCKNNYKLYVFYTSREIKL